ncbi:MAG TPA: hypothetical protein VK540_06210 [Polyangiaceae bacterium]|jgi:hypothetical protein|nr:hypothetical protein [Polyangiaceae bacterium]
MGRRLLYFPILRTRSARKKLVGGSVIVLLGILALEGCEEDTPPRPAELQTTPGPMAGQPGASSGAGSGQPSAMVRDEVARRVAEELEALAVEAGIERGHDLVAPGGDLLRDLQEFTSIDACVRAHRVTDPVLADAVDTSATTHWCGMRAAFLGHSNRRTTSSASRSPPRLSVPAKALTSAQ